MLRRTAGALRREPEVRRYIPYSAHVAPAVLRTRSGDYLQVFRLGGASFESADAAPNNRRAERLDGPWRKFAQPGPALWSPGVCPGERSAGPAAAGAGVPAAETVAAVVTDMPDGEDATDAVERKPAARDEHEAEAPWRLAKRNDPCPCGSGRKAKVCHQRPLPDGDAAPASAPAAPPACQCQSSAGSARLPAQRPAA